MMGAICVAAGDALSVVVKVHTMLSVGVFCLPLRCFAFRLCRQCSPCGNFIHFYCFFYTRIAYQRY